MRLSSPRVPPVDPEALRGEARELLERLKDDAAVQLTRRAPARETQQVPPKLDLDHAPDEVASVLESSDRVLLAADDGDGRRVVLACPGADDAGTLLRAAFAEIPAALVEPRQN